MGRRKKGGRDAVPGAGQDVGAQRRYRKPRKAKQPRLEGQVDRIVKALADGEVQVSPRDIARRNGCTEIRVIEPGTHERVPYECSAIPGYRGWDRQEWDLLCAAVADKDYEVVGDRLVVHANIW